ncbi:hypothetical protein WH47_07088 [Habropoda laboriosa]|uniref:Uncharacterized protein n=1 Tax=Habropoda laboriosa TaxID=597456 RepID=A0A0L7RGE8_9HYME|nr:hypothetical protein WH47_07088 [Habropoda laboriosa]
MSNKNRLPKIQIVEHYSTQKFLEIVRNTYKRLPDTGIQQSQWQQWLKPFYRFLCFGGEVEECSRGEEIEENRVKEECRCGDSGEGEVAGQKEEWKRRSPEMEEEERGKENANKKEQRRRSGAREECACGEGEEMEDWKGEGIEEVWRSDYILRSLNANLPGIPATKVSEVNNDCLHGKLESVRQWIHGGSEHIVACFKS